MTKRILSCFASDFDHMNGDDLLEAIRESEGRTVMAETICTASPILEDVTNAETAAAFGADILLLNLYDVNEPVIKGLPKHDPQETIPLLKKLTGRPIGINLEPAPLRENDSPWALTAGRQATGENALKAVESGVSLILLTGNPGIGVENEEIITALREIRAAIGNRAVLAAGKMHASGIVKEAADAIMTMQDIELFAEAGADIILIPAPGTIPGVDLQWAKERVRKIHQLGKLAVTAIGTSQEGADSETIRHIALLSKQCGADIHHIGDSGLFGMALPENIMTYGITIRGIRHTYHRMAASINR